MSVITVEGEAPVTTVATRSGVAAKIPAPRRRTRHRVSAVAVLVLVIGLALTAGLSWLAKDLNENNEDRLLDLETKQVATVLQVVIPTIQTPLAASAQAAAASSGDVASFRSYISAYLANRTFVSVSLWRVSATSARSVAVVGAPSALAADPKLAQQFLIGATKNPGLAVTQPLAPNGPSPRLGYAFAAGKGAVKYAVSAESPLPPGRKIPNQAGTQNSPFSDLRNFAVYLGPKADPALLLESNLDQDQLPIKDSSQAVVPFGSTSITLVASSNGQLGGSLSGRLWWVLAIAGTVIAIAAAFMVERLVRGRRSAERLTGEVEHLLGEQRSIAETLQRALLPQVVPEVTGVEIAVRYIPGEHGVEIGGDWYDLMPLDERRFFFVVGDVSGRGVAAGSVMASLHFAIRGFVSEGHSPAKVLNTLAGLLNVSRDEHFATVLCGMADVERHEITFANAGHLPPLVVGNGTSTFVSTEVGPPIGVGTGAMYEPTTVSVPPGGMFLVYTDGLVERRGESLDAGLARLKSSVASSSGALEDLLDNIAADLAQEGQDDDTAILGVKWVN